MRTVKDDVLPVRIPHSRDLWLVVDQDRSGNQRLVAGHHDPSSPLSAEVLLDPEELVSDAGMVDLLR